MGKTVNKTDLIGRLGNDPEIKTFESGSKLITLNIATEDDYVNKNTGEKIEETEWHKVEVWGNLTNIAKLAKKGEKIYIEGRAKSKKYMGKNNVEMTYSFIRANNIVLLGK